MWSGWYWQQFWLHRVPTFQEEDGTWFERYKGNQGRGANLRNQLALGHRCQIKCLSQPLSLLKLGKGNFFFILSYYCWYFLRQYSLKNQNKPTSTFVTQNCLVRKCIAKYYACNALFTLVLGTAQCKTASKLVCHLVAMNLLWVTNKVFFLLSCSVSFMCFFCLLLCSLGQCLLFRWWGQQRQRGGNFAVPFVMFHMSTAQGLSLVVKDSQHWCV